VATIGGNGNDGAGGAGADGANGSVPEDRVTITARRADGRSARDGGAGATYTFEDVHFDFNKSQLRKPDLDTLRSAVAALKADPTLVLNLEGYTCNVGTKEYNLALGDRRANAVKSYLVSEGIAADRLRTISYGEERPKYDNSKAATRRLNRRVAIVPAATP
jgi:outer membrane protein OmpA-like peptidoglycan-associated protein